MPDHFPVIGILGKAGDSRVNETLRTLLDFLAARSHGLVLSRALADASNVEHEVELPSHRMFTDKHGTCDFTIFIEYVHRDDIFMSSDLKNGIHRGIDNGITCFYMLGSQFL